MIQNHKEGFDSVSGVYPGRFARQAATVPKLRLKLKKLLEKLFEFGPKFGEKSLKIEAPGALLRSSVTLLAPRWPKMRFGAHLGFHVDGYPSWPTWRQDAPKIANLELKMANLAHFWEHFGDLFWILDAILSKMAKTKKTMTGHHFGRFFGVLGLLLEAMLAHLGAMLAYVGPSWRHFRATWRQDGVQERQDEPR